MRRVVPVVLACAATLLSALTLDAQQALRSQPSSPTPQSTFRARTDLIPVDVSVLDRDRHPVRGLTAADFTVLEDGKPRPVVAFSVVDVPGPVRVASVAPWVRDAPHDVVSNDLPDEGRLVVILLDGTIPNGTPAMTAQKIARAAVDQLGPGDLAAVVRSTIFSHNGLMQGFTRDRSRLIAAIDSPFMGTITPPEMGPGGLQSPAPVPDDMYQTKRSCEVVADIARAMQRAPRRRKMLLMIGTTIDISGPLESGGDIRTCRDEMLRQLDLSNVTVQAVDPAGLNTTSVSADYITHGQISPSLVPGWNQRNQFRLDNLRVLPDYTGGRLVANTNTPEQFVPAIFAESQMYYLLGFEPARPTAGGSFHRIAVQVHRRGMTVHARSGYLTEAPAPAASVSAAVPAPTDAAAPGHAELTRLLDGPLPRHDLPLTIASAPLRATAGPDAVVSVSLGATLPPGSGARRINVVVGAFDQRGRSVGVRTETLEVSPEMAARGQVDEGLLAQLNLPPGRYELRAAAEDETSGARGSVFSFVDVPAFDHGSLTASGVLLHSANTSLVVDGLLADVVPFVPTVARTFHSTDDAHAFVRCYAPPPLMSTVPVRTRVMDATGATAFDHRADLAPDAFTDGAADVDFPLPLAQLSPGDYLLVIELGAGESHAERNVRFSVIKP